MKTIFVPQDRRKSVSNLNSRAALSILLLLGGAAICHAQTSVNQSDGAPSGAPIQTVYVYSGSSLVGQCWAKSLPDSSRTRTATVAISAISKASAAVITSTGHGLTLLTLPQVTISGATGTGWATGINGTFTATVIDANTFSVPVDSSAFGTLAGTVVFSTSAPRQTIAEWAVQIFAYGGPSGAISSKTWLQGSNSYGAKCSDVTSTTVGRQ